MSTPNNIPFNYKETGYNGCYEVSNTSIVSKGFYAFELSYGAKIASWSYTNGTTVTAEANASSVFSSMPASGALGGLYFMPIGIVGTQIQLSTGAAKLWLAPTGSVCGLAFGPSQPVNSTSGSVYI
jgi:hypothetical protein